MQLRDSSTSATTMAGAVAGSGAGTLLVSLRLASRPPSRRAVFEFLAGQLAGVLLTALVLSIAWSATSHDAARPRHAAISFVNARAATPQPVGSMDATTATTATTTTTTTTTTTNDWWRAPQPVGTSARSKAVAACVVLPSKDSWSAESERFTNDVVNATWASRCDAVVFATHAGVTKTLPALNLGPDARANDWATMREALRLARFPPETDIVVVGDDASYVVVDNIRAWYRRDFSSGGGYAGRSMDAGAYCDARAFVLSRAVVDALREALTSGKCPSSAQSKSLAGPALGQCLRSLGMVDGCTDLVDARGKRQVMNGDPFRLLSEPFSVVRTRPDPECLSLIHI